MNRNSRTRLLASLVSSLLLPLRVAALTHAAAAAAAAACFVTSTHYQTTSSRAARLFVSSGFSFQDGDQVLVSVQKPLGIILEERQAQPQDDSNDDETAGTVIFVTEMDPDGSASRAGVLTGDVLLAVQNASVENRSLEYIMAFLAQAPRVVNLRFLRQTT
jgi:predicted metalloprotease with PDZ domain